jgi:hypothetical protein
MPVNSVFWFDPRHPNEPEGGYDVHVIANIGPSQSLTDLLFLKTTLGDKTATEWNNESPQRISVFLAPQFRAVDMTVNPIKHATNDVSVNTKTGVVTFNQHAPPPADILHNFVIRTVITDENGATFANSPAIRIHLHPLIVSPRIMPPILTAHKTGADAGAVDTPVRFRILAEFGDDTNGDITNHPGIVWDTGDFHKVLVRATTAEFWPVASAATDDLVDIKAKLPPSLGGTTITGKIRVADPLTTAVTVKPVGQPPGTVPHADRVNVLFLSEGYLGAGNGVASQEPEFDAGVRAAMQAMENPRLFPLNRMPDTINFWSAFVPSRQAGPSILYEAFNPRPFDPWYEVVNPPRMAGAHTPSIKDVLSVALPVPADQTTDLATQQARWTNLYGVVGLPLAAVDAAVHDRWRQIGDRYLIDETDTAFGLTYGERPRYDLRLVPRTLGLSPLRMKRGTLDLMLSHLSLDGKWATPGSPSYPYVVFLCAGSRDGGARDPGTQTLAFGVHTQVQFQAQVQGFAHQAVLQPYQPSTNIAIHTAATMVHELAHAVGVTVKQYKVGLGDEYGEFPKDQAISQTDEDQIATFANLESAKTVQDVGGALNGQNIHWATWHRITTAAVITTDLPPFTNGPIQIGHQGTAAGEKFEPNDIVRIRHRPLANAPNATDPLQIVSVDSPTQITVKPVGGTVSLLLRGKGDIVFVPRRDGNRELMMMAQAVRDHITATNRPLNAPRPPANAPGPPAPYPCKATGTEPQDALNLPAEGPNFKLKKYYTWIVGLYDGGMQFNCGVYHPTGTCLMRRTTRAYLGDIRNAIYAFCPVCRYILIDNLDPRMHGAADRAYQTIWPEP